MAVAARVLVGRWRPLMMAAGEGEVEVGPPPPSPPASPPASPPPPRRRRGKRRRPQPGGLRRTLPVSPAMKKFLGVPEISRPDVVKKIWEYIKLHGLQNPADRREILCDDKLKAIFDGKEKVGMLEIAKLIGPHFVKK